MPGYRIEIPPLHGNALALGYVIVTWGYLQSSIRELLKALLPIQDNITKNILAAHISERDQCKMIRELAWHKVNALTTDKEPYERLLSTLTVVDDTLRPKRNRFVHDLWVATSEQGNPILIDQRTRMARTDPSGPKVPMQHEQRNISEEDIWDFVQEIQSATAAVMEFRMRVPPHIDPFRE